MTEQRAHLPGGETDALRGVAGADRPDAIAQRSGGNCRTTL
jgi:hypothetical protein